MPFRIQDIPAYKKLVLDELRTQARTPGTETNKIIQASVGYWPDGNPKYDGAIVQAIKGAQGCYNSASDVLWYCYCYMPQHFDALQRVIQIEEAHAAGEFVKTFSRKVFNTNGDLLVIDVGCGPMTSGLALADWHVNAYKSPLKLSYIGIDSSQHCRDFASRFAERIDLFDMQHEPLFRTDCANVKIDELHHGYRAMARCCLFSRTYSDRTVANRNI